MTSLCDSPVPSGNHNKHHLLEFRAGKMVVTGKMVQPDRRKGLVFIYQSDDSIMHFCWKDRTTGTVEDDLMVFPNDIEFKHISQCTTGRVYVLKFKSSSRKFFFWLQEPRADRDEEICRKVNDYLNNPPTPPSSSRSSRDLPHDLPGRGEQDLQSILRGMNQQQLVQLLNGMGMGGGSPSSELLGSLLGQAGSVQSSDTELQSFSQLAVARAVSAQAASSQSHPMLASSTLPTQRTAGSASRDNTLSEYGSTSVSANSREGGAHIQLNHLQNNLSVVNGVDSAKSVNPEDLIPMLVNPEVQWQFAEFFPEGSFLPQTKDELRDSMHSAQFQQVLTSFSAALQSGHLGHLMSQFGLGEDVINAATLGDTQAFIRAMQEAVKKKKAEDDDDCVSMEHWPNSSLTNNQGNEHCEKEQMPSKDALIEQILSLLHNKDHYELFCHFIYNSCFDSGVPDAQRRVYVAGAFDAVPQFSKIGEFNEILQQKDQVNRTDWLGEMYNCTFLCDSPDEMRCLSPTITAPEAFECLCEVQDGSLKITEGGRVNLLDVKLCPRVTEPGVLSLSHACMQQTCTITQIEDREGAVVVENSDQEGRSSGQADAEVKFSDSKCVYNLTGSLDLHQRELSGVHVGHGGELTKVEVEVQDRRAKISEEDKIKALNLPSEFLHTGNLTCLQNKSTETYNIHGEIVSKDKGEVQDKFINPRKDSVKSLDVKWFSKVADPELTTYCGHTYQQQNLNEVRTVHGKVVKWLQDEIKDDGFGNSTEDEEKLSGFNRVSCKKNPELISSSCQACLRQRNTGVNSRDDEMASSTESELKSLPDWSGKDNSECFDIVEDNSSELVKIGDNSAELIKVENANTFIFGVEDGVNDTHDTSPMFRHTGIQKEPEQMVRENYASAGLFIEDIHQEGRIQLNDGHNEKEVNFVHVKLAHEKLKYAKCIQSSMMVATFLNRKHDIIIEEDVEQSKDVTGLDNTTSYTRNESAKTNYIQPTEICILVHQEDAINDRGGASLRAFESSVDVNDGHMGSTGEYAYPVHRNKACNNECSLDSCGNIVPEFDSSVDGKESSTDILIESPRICVDESPVDFIEYRIGNQEEKSTETVSKHMIGVSECDSRQQIEYSATGVLESRVKESGRDSNQTEQILCANGNSPGTSSTQGHKGFVSQFSKRHGSRCSMGNKRSFIHECSVGTDVESVNAAVGSGLERNTPGKDCAGCIDIHACDMENEGMDDVIEITMQNKTAPDTHEYTVENNETVFSEINKCHVKHKAGQEYLIQDGYSLDANKVDQECLIQDGYSLDANKVDQQCLIQDGCCLDGNKVDQECLIQDGCSLDGNKVDQECLIQDGCSLDGNKIDHKYLKRDGCNLDGNKVGHEHLKQDDCNLDGNKEGKDDLIQDGCSLDGNKVGQEHLKQDGFNLDGKKVSQEHHMQDFCNINRSKVSDEHHLMDGCDQDSGRGEYGKSIDSNISEVMREVENSRHFSESNNEAVNGSLAELNCWKEDCKERLVGISKGENDGVIHQCHISDVPDSDADLGINMSDEKKTDWNARKQCVGKEIEWQLPASADGELPDLSPVAGFKGIPQGPSKEKFSSRSCTELYAAKTGICGPNVPLALTHEMAGYISSINAGIFDKKEIDIEMSEEISFPSTSILCDNETEEVSGDVSEDINADSRPTWNSIVGFDHLDSDVSCVASSRSDTVKVDLAASQGTEANFCQYVTVDAADETNLERDETGWDNSLQIVITGRDGKLQLPSALVKSFEREVGLVYSKYLRVNNLLHRGMGSDSEEKVFDCGSVCEPAADLALMAASCEESGFADTLYFCDPVKQDLTGLTGKTVVRCSSLNSLQKFFASQPGFECAHMKELIFQSPGCKTVSTVYDDQCCFWKTCINQVDYKEENSDTENKLGQLSETYVHVYENADTTRDSQFGTLERRVVREESTTVLTGAWKPQNSPVLPSRAGPDCAHVVSSQHVIRTSSFTTNKIMQLESRSFKQEDVKSVIPITRHEAKVERGRDFEHCCHFGVPSLDEESLLDMANTEQQDYQSELFRSAAGMASFSPEHIQSQDRRVQSPVFGCMPCSEYEDLTLETDCRSHFQGQDNQTIVASSINQEAVPQKIDIAIQKATPSTDNGGIPLNRKLDITVQKTMSSTHNGRRSVKRKVAGMTENAENVCHHPAKLSLTCLRQKTTCCLVFETSQSRTGMQEQERSYLNTLFWVCLALAVLIFNLL